MKILMKNPVFTFILGIVLCGSVGVVASTLISSTDVTYNDTTAKAALDDLYNKVSTMITQNECVSKYLNRTSVLNISSQHLDFPGGSSYSTRTITKTFDHAGFIALSTIIGANASGQAPDGHTKRITVTEKLANGTSQQILLLSNSSNYAHYTTYTAKVNAGSTVTISMYGQSMYDHSINGVNAVYLQLVDPT